MSNVNNVSNVKLDLERENSHLGSGFGKDVDAWLNARGIFLARRGSEW